MTSTARRLPRVGNGARAPFDRIVSVVAWAVALVILLPLAGIVLRLIGADYLQSAGAAFTLPGLPRVLLNTVLVIGASTLFAVVVGCALAWLNEATNARMGWMTDVLPVVPLLVPSIAGAIGWVLLASPTAGFINVAGAWITDVSGIPVPTLSIFSWPGLIFVYMLYMVPQVYLTVSAALRNIDPAIEEAARVSGSGRLRTLRTVTFPAVRPAILSGALLALVYGVALFSVPLIIGTQARIEVLTVQIVRLLTFTFPPRLGEAVTLSLLVAVTLGIVWFVNARLARRGNFATIGGKSSGQNRVELSRPVQFAARAVMLAYLVVSAVLPLAALVLVSLQPFWSGDFFVPLTFENYGEVFEAGAQTVEGLRNSVLLAVVAATVAMVLAVLIAYRIADPRYRVFGRFIDATTKLPGTLSHVVVAVALLASLAGPPFGLSGTLVLLLLAYVILYMPQATVSAQSANQVVGRELFEASLVSGRGPGGTLRRVVLPLTRSGLAAGWAFVFVLVVGDITASAILASPSSPVIGFVILTLFQNGTYPLLAALGAVISAVSSVIVLTTLVIAGRRGAQQAA